MATLDYSLIGIEDVKTLTPSNVNLGHTVNVTEAIRASQRDHLISILGDELYEEVISQAESNTLTPANQALVDRAAQMLAYYSLLHIVDYTNTQIRDVGVVQMNGDNYSRDEKGFNLLKGRISGTAENERRLFEKWLCKNAADYPLWWSSDWYSDAYWKNWLPQHLYGSQFIQVPPKRSTTGITYVGSFWRRG